MVKQTSPLDPRQAPPRHRIRTTLALVRRGSRSRDAGARCALAPAARVQRSYSTPTSGPAGAGAPGRGARLVRRRRLRRDANPRTGVARSGVGASCSTAREPWTVRGAWALTNGLTAGPSRSPARGDSIAGRSPPSPVLMRDDRPHLRPIRAQRNSPAIPAAWNACAQSSRTLTRLKAFAQGRDRAFGLGPRRHHASTPRQSRRICGRSAPFRIGGGSTGRVTAARNNR